MLGAVARGVELRGARDEPPLRNGEATAAKGRKKIEKRYKQKI